MHKDSTAVLILHFGDAALTYACLSSIQSAALSNGLEAIIIDNSDGQDFSLPKDLDTDSVKILKSGKNLGYAGGMNYGIRHCLEKGYAYLFLLNNDTEVAPGCVSKLRQFLQSKKRAGIAAPLILYSENRQRIWSTGSRLILFRGKTKDSFHNHSISDLPKSGNVDAVTGCAMMIKAEVFKNIGLFDESYFAYFEDVDLCYRAGLYGYAVYFVSGASVYHRVSSASKHGAQIRKTSDFFMIRNRIYFMQKFAPRSGLALFYAFLPLEAAVYLAKSFIRLQIHKPVRFLVGMREGLLPRPLERKQPPGVEVSACIITKNAAQTIETCLRSVAGAVQEIVVLDSGSTDDTVAFCRKYTDKIFTTEFKNDYASLRNQAAKLAEKPWILALDADEAISEELRENLTSLLTSSPYRAYSLKRINYYGQSIICFGYAGFDSLVRLYQKQGAFFYGKVHERLISQGPIKRTKLRIVHKPAENNFTRKSFRTKWMSYAAIEAESQTRSGHWGILRFLGAPLVFCLAYLKEILLLLGFLDGTKGFKIAYFRALYTYHVFRARSGRMQP